MSLYRPHDAAPPVDHGRCDCVASPHWLHDLLVTVLVCALGGVAMVANGLLIAWLTP